MRELSILQLEVRDLLAREHTSYAQPLNSEYIGRALNITPSYIRRQLTRLVKERLIGVRRGNGGGYYIIGEDLRTNDYTV